ncbi:hypothetical protein [Kibdelosporangium philippinense]|uniref:hypothetical protein n=1 Tax=Kibdelosporangium philippinense TaxID=211113 RepID=UPI003614D429
MHRRYEPRSVDATELIVGIEVPESAFHCVGTVDTVFRNGGHGRKERWTRCSGMVDTAEVGWVRRARFLRL